MTEATEAPGLLIVLLGQLGKLLILARSDATFAAGTGYALGYTNYDSKYERDIGQGHRIVGRPTIIRCSAAEEETTSPTILMAVGIRVSSDKWIL